MSAGDDRTRDDDQPVDAIVCMGAVVLKSVSDNAIVVGNPARALERKTTSPA